MMGIMLNAKVTRTPTRNLVGSNTTQNVLDYLVTSHFGGKKGKVMEFLALFRSDITRCSKHGTLMWSLQE